MNEKSREEEMAKKKTKNEKKKKKDYHTRVYCTCKTRLVLEPCTPCSVCNTSSIIGAVGSSTPLSVPEEILAVFFILFIYRMIVLFFSKFDSCCAV